MGAVGDIEVGEVARERLPGIGVACFPYSGGQQNPYFSLCYEHLADLGFVALPGTKLTLRWLWRRRGDVMLLHFHWQPDWFYLAKRRLYTARPSRVPRFRSILKLVAFALRLRAARLFGYRIAWTIHEVFPPRTVLRPPQLGRLFDRIGERVLARNCHLLIAHHRSVAIEAAAELALNPDRIRVIPHGAYLDRYPAGRSRREVRAELGISVGAFVFLAFGTMRPDKSIGHLLAAFRAVRNPNVALVVAGRVEDLESVRHLHAAARADPRIRPLPGFVPEEDVRELFDAVDASVLARTESWTSGSVILSLSLGVPVVCARLSAHEQLLDERAGWLFDPATAGGLTSALEEAASSSAVELDARRLAAGEAARALPTWAEIAERLAVLMREAIGTEADFEQLAARVWPLLRARSPLWQVFPVVGESVLLPSETGRKAYSSGGGGAAAPPSSVAQVTPVRKAKTVSARDDERILLLTPSAKAGGAERAFVSLASLLQRENYRPQVSLLEHGPLERWLQEAGCTYSVAPAEAGSSREASVDWVTQEACRAGAAAIVSNKSEGHLVGGEAAYAMDVPAIWWQQDIACGIDYELAAASVPVAAVVCSSDYALSAQRTLTPTARIRKVHLGVPVAEIGARRGSGAAVRADLGSNGRPLVGIVGRLEVWKGQDVFLLAAARVHARYPEAIYLIVGGPEPLKEPNYPAELQGLARQLGIEDQVRFVGHVNDVFPWLDALDVCVHATHGESFGLVLVEAMALGTPVVATALGGPLEIVEEGASGLLVPPGDEEAMARATCAILADRPLAKRLAEGGRRRALSFTRERMASAFGEVIREVLSA